MLRNFLSYIVQEKLNNNEEVIKQYSIAVHAFGRSPDFDAGSDPIVRIQAGRLRNSLQVYYQQEGKNDTVEIKLVKGSYVPEINFFSPSSNDKSSDSSTAKAEYLRSIVLFPLRNLSPDDQKQLVVDGFTEELLAELSHYRHLHVVRANEELNKATRKSLARFALDGSLRFGQSLAKISLTLTDNYNREVLWTMQKRFETDNTDIIELQEEVAASVAQEVAGINGVVSEKLYSESNWEHNRNPTAYDTYLHFYRYTHDPSPENIERVLTKVTAAVEAEPDFAPGWAVLARIYGDAYSWGLDKTMLEKALSSGKKSVELQPNNQSCHTYYAYALTLSGRYEAAQRHCRRALELNPNSVHYVGAVGFLYCLMDDEELGRDLIVRSISWDFRYPWWFHFGTFVYHLKRNEFDAALREAEKMNAIHFWASITKLVAHFKAGNEEEAMGHLQDLMELKPDFFDQPRSYIEALVKSEGLRAVLCESIFQVIDLSQTLHS